MEMAIATQAQILKVLKAFNPWWVTGAVHPDFTKHYRRFAYYEAMKRLEEIVSRIESNELDIDQLGEYLQEAQKLIKFCKNKLYKADAEIKKILEEDNEAQA